MLSITLLTNPELLLTRVANVTVGAGGAETLREKIQGNLAFLGAPVALIRHQFFTNTRGSWFLLSVPALGGLVVPLVAGAWVVTVWTLERRVRYVVLLLGLAIGLAALTTLQDLVTDFSDYRQFPLLFALCTTGLAFAFRLPSIRGPRRAVAAAYAIGFATYNYVDLGNLHGATHGVETAYRSQAAMDGLRRFVDAPDAVRRLGAERVLVVVDPFFPLEPLYLDVLKPKAGVPLETVPVAEVCQHGRLSIGEVSRRACEPVLVVADARHCAVGERARPPDRTPSVRGWRFESVCDRPLDERADRSVVDVDVDGG
jgi:hypothetical protein